MMVYANEPVEAEQTAGMTRAIGASPQRPEDADRGRLAEDDKLGFIDTLRGLAIIGVIWVHHSQSFHDLQNVRSIAGYGQLGVQLFFVASAFTLSRSASIRRTEQSPIRSFFIRRFFRIAPLYYLAIALYMAVGSAWLIGNEYQKYGIYTPLNVLLNLTFLHSFSPAAYNSVVPGGWSIGTEMMFYLCFPWLYRWFASSYRRLGIGALAIGLPAALAFDGLMQWAIYHFTGNVIKQTNIVYSHLINQLPVFLIGIAAYFMSVDGKLKPRLMRDVAAFAGLTLVGFTLFKSKHLALDVGVGLSLLPTIAGVSFLFLMNIARLDTPLRRSRLLARIGQLSYSIYIFHFLFVWPMVRAILRLFQGVRHEQELLYFPTLVLAIGASCLVALFSKWLIEDRFIDLGKVLIRAMDARAHAGQPAKA